jgi:hypothetical protein
MFTRKDAHLSMQHNSTPLGLLRATVFRHFSGFAGFRTALRGKMKARGRKGDGGNFPCKMELREAWGLSPPSPPDFFIPHIQIKMRHSKNAGYCPC